MKLLLLLRALATVVAVACTLLCLFGAIAWRGPLRKLAGLAVFAGLGAQLGIVAGNAVSKRAPWTRALIPLFGIGLALETLWKGPHRGLAARRPLRRARSRHRRRRRRRDHTRAAALAKRLRRRYPRTRIRALCDRPAQPFRRRRTRDAGDGGTILLRRFPRAAADRFLVRARLDGRPAAARGSVSLHPSRDARARSCARLRAVVLATGQRLLACLRGAVADRNLRNRAQPAASMRRGSPAPPQSICDCASR